MPYCPVFVLGGLPLIADVWFSGPDYNGEYDSGVDGLYWQRRDGSRGKAISPTLKDRIEDKDQYWEANCTEQANEWLSVSCPTRYRGQILGEYSPEYLLLNPKTHTPPTEPD
jgi:hypothetical protein